GASDRRPIRPRSRSCIVRAICTDSVTVRLAVVIWSVPAGSVEDPPGEEQALSANTSRRAGPTGRVPATLLWARGRALDAHHRDEERPLPGRRGRAARPPGHRRRRGGQLGRLGAGRGDRRARGVLALPMREVAEQALL